MYFLGVVLMVSLNVIQIHVFVAVQALIDLNICYFLLCYYIPFQMTNQQQRFLIGGVSGHC